MIYLLTESTMHLHLPAVKVEKKYFPDGELSIRICQSLKGRKVTYISNITNDNLLEFLFILDAALRGGAKIEKIIIPYLGFARQDRLFEAGQAISIAVIGRILQDYQIPIEVYDVHSEHVKKYFPFAEKSFLPDLTTYLPKDHYVVISPDKGGIKRAKEVAKILQVPMMSLKKTRTKDQVAISGKVNVKGRNILIVEDMIATGATLHRAAKYLKKQGAADIFVIASHGVFTKGSFVKLAKSEIKKIYISNSIHVKPHSKVKVCPCL